jgi:hypothetical protein
MSLCEFCSKGIEINFGSGRFCSRKCSNSFSSNIKKNERNKKISDSLTRKNREIYYKQCKNCEKIFYSERKKQSTCSIKCASLLRNKNEEYLKRISDTLKRKKPKKEKQKIKKDGRLKSSNNKGGRCKWFEFIKENGEKIKVQGTYELRFSKILDLYDPDWIKPSIFNRNHRFEWVDANNISHWYTPDFWSPKYGIYFETKGYWARDQLEKKKFIESINNLIIVYKKDLDLMELKNTIFID